MRRDLHATRATGNVRSLCVTLCNLEALYVDLKQFGPARGLINEATDVSIKLDDWDLPAWPLGLRRVGYRP
jgi:hypothetical protein